MLDSSPKYQIVYSVQALSWAFNPATGSIESWQGWQPAGATNKYKQIVIIGECPTDEGLCCSLKESAAVCRSSKNFLLEATSTAK